MSGVMGIKSAIVCGFFAGLFSFVLNAEESFRLVLSAGALAEDHGAAFYDSRVFHPEQGAPFEIIDLGVAHLHENVAI